MFFSEAEEQAEPGAEHKAPSAEGVSEQAHTGSGGDGAAPGRTAPKTVEEESSSATERKPACECKTEHQLILQHVTHTSLLKPLSLWL